MIKLITDLAGRSPFEPTKLYGALRVYTFFKQYEMDIDVEFTLQDVYACMYSHDPTYLLEYLFIKLLNMQKHQFNLISDNKCVRDCQLFASWQSCYTQLVNRIITTNRKKYRGSTFDFQDLLIKPFSSLEFNDKQQIMVTFINEYAPSLEFILQSVQNHVSLLKQINQNKVNFSLQITAWSAELIDSIEQLKYKQQLVDKLSYSNLQIKDKKKLHLAKQDLVTIKTRINTLKPLVALNNFELMKLFKTNHHAIIGQVNDIRLWINRTIPNTLFISIDDEYYELFGEEVFELDILIVKNLIELEYFKKEVREQVRISEAMDYWQRQSRIFQYDHNGYQQYLEYGGNPQYLVYGEILNPDRIAIDIILDIEAMISEYWGKQHQQAWAYQQERDVWRNTIAETQSSEQVSYVAHSLIATLNIMSTTYYKYDNEQMYMNNKQHNEKYERSSTKVIFKKILPHMQLSEQCNGYSLALLLYFMTIEYLFKKQQSIKDEESRRKPSRKSKSRAIVDDESDLSDYYY